MQAIEFVTETNINNIGSPFNFPEITQESINNAYDDGDYIAFYFDGKYLPDEIRNLLHELAKAEIERNTNCEELPEKLIDEKKYFLGIFIDKTNNSIGGIKIGCELLLTDDWKKVRGATKYKEYISKHIPCYFTNNLTKMCISYPALDIVLTTESEKNRLFEMVNEHLKSDKTNK